MSSSNGIFQRGSSHYLRVVLPKEHPLQKLYKSGKVVVSLKACSYRDAVTAGAIKRAEILGWSESKAMPSTSRNPPLKREHLTEYFLRDIYNRWKESKPRSADSINSCNRSLLLYEEFTKNPALHQLTRAQGDGFRTWLQQPERKTASKTAYDRFTWVKSLLKYAYRDLELLSRHPWEGIELYTETTNKRRPWTAPELQILFGQALFINYELPRDKKLLTSDISATDDIPTISISNTGLNQQLKTTASIRTIPIHSELIRLGFMEYVRTLDKTVAESLWPALSKRKNKPGGYFSNWFGEYRASFGLKGYPDFHCFRHTVRSQLGEAEVPEHVIDSILGHEIKGSTGTKVYTHRTLKTLKSAIELLKYECVTMPEVYRNKINI